ncbi:hypothetical protein TeGR_g7705 [Tetraparma gracilis]|uniref:(S)-ureidoglycine aminohydrolase cupin domain-containing protein n=1 Tax=Tetraparma gracilis TaxID=2962635 RepID=A0ABQ6MUR0_9STRA|nr:hypothetical protein TeGR_g7705 [Tetraparma gracilis]
MSNKSLVVEPSSNLLCDSSILEPKGQAKNSTSGPGSAQLRGRVISRENGVTSGVWECGAGSFEVLSRVNTETIYILSGSVILTDLLARPQKKRTLNAGDSAVLEFGSSVRWEVPELVRKFYVVSPKQMSNTEDDDEH